MLWKFYYQKPFGSAFTFTALKHKAFTGRRQIHVLSDILYISVKRDIEILTHMDSKRLHTQQASFQWEVQKETCNCTLLPSSFCILFVLNKLYLSICWKSRPRQKEEYLRGRHCREPSCQHTAPTLMTLLLCTIHKSKASPTVSDSAIYVKNVVSMGYTVLSFFNRI